MGKLNGWSPCGLAWLMVSGALWVGSLGAQQAPPSAPGDAPSAVYKSPYRVIDVHVHGPLPAEQALQAHFEAMDASGIDAVTILLFDPAGWQYQGGWSEFNLRAWLRLRKQHSQRLSVFGTVDFGRAAKEPDFFRQIVAELHTAAEWGAQGVKIWKNLGMHHRDMSGALIKIDDPRLDPFWKACGDLGLPVLIHSADPKEYWYPNSFNTFQYNLGDTAKYYKHPVVPAWEELIRQRNHVVQKHPRTTFIGAHFGSLSSDFDRLADLLDKNPNFFVECGARLRFMYRYHPQAIHDFFVKYQDRILFGTDTFLLQEERILEDQQSRKAWQERVSRFCSGYLEYFETDHYVSVPGGYQDSWLRLKGIRLPPEVLEKLYYTNAQRLIPGLAKNDIPPGAAPRP
jgi:predicted TIM-barrel fold metal-dependent hydrolase